jgi:chromosome segregation ATPase
MKKEHDLEENDFGFSFVDDAYEEVKEVKEKLEKDYSSSVSQIEDLQARLDEMYSSIELFLDNLCKNPEKSTIHWPNRVEKIQSYKKKLEKIAKG